MSRLLILPLAAILAVAGCKERENTSPEPKRRTTQEDSSVPLRAMAAPRASTPVLTADGYGPIRIGMSLGEASKALGSPLTPPSAEELARMEAEGLSADCYEIVVPAFPGLALMFESGRIMRVSVFENSLVKTERGIGIGSSEADVVRAYPQGLRVELNKHSMGNAKDLTFWTEPGKRGIRFQTAEDGIVRWMHAGSKSIEYYEGCL